MTTQVYSLSICGRATINLHSLNNEGGEGNQIQTRMVDIVGADGEFHNVNAISGDMFKHIQAEHLHRIGRGKLDFCKACEQFNANRISADPDFRQYLKGKPESVDVINQLIHTCAMDDMEGNLITEGKSPAPRKSVVEFGWVVGLPGTRTEQYFHVKYALDKPEKSTVEGERESNLSQTIFHRPTSSGIYAAVVHAELARIGYNDISQKYVEGVDRLARYKALLESLIYTFVEPNGAMKNTQMPHLVDFKGAVSYSTDVIPAPNVSPLHNDFVGQMQKIATALNKLRPDKAIKVEPFDSLAEFTEIMQDLIDTTSPYQLNV